MYSPFLITDGPFSRPAEWKLSSSWKICSPTGLTKRLTRQITKKTGLWPWTQLSASLRTVLFQWNVVDHAASRAPRRWTTARPRKGTTQSWGRRSSGCPLVEYDGSLVRCGVRLPLAQNNRGCGWVEGWPGQRWEYYGDGEASVAAQPATGGRSMRHDRCCFGRLGQEEELLKKQHGHWINIQRSLLQELFVD